MFGSIPASMSHVVPPTPFSMTTGPPITPSTATSTPGYLPPSQLFTSPSYTLSSNIRTPYSASVPQPGQGGQFRTVEDTHTIQQDKGGGRGGGVLFSHPLYVVVQGGDGEKRQQLVVTVSTTPMTGTQAKSITIVITSGSDHFLYYSLSLTEEDFMNLRSQQGLLVDFANFPTMVVQLLEKCFSEGQTSQPKFVLVLNCNKAQPCLEFTELNMFKHLVHLSLVVLRATDTQLKDYMVSCIMNVTKEKDMVTSELQNTVESLQQQLHSRNELLQEKSSELEHFKTDHMENNTKLEERLAKELEEEKEKTSQQLQELQWKGSREKREMETMNTKTLQQLENRVASLDVQNRDLVEIRYKHEACLREVKGQLSSKEEELARVKMEMTNIRKEKEMLQSSGGDRDRRSTQLSTRLAVVEQELVDKEGLVRQQKEMVRQGDEARDRLAKEVDEKTRLVERRETAVKTVTGELLKANEIIRKLQDGVKQEQGKSRLRGQIATEQERLLGEKEKEMAECREQLREGKELMSRLNIKVSDLNKMLGEKDHKIEELEKVLKTNENVINWLNKQITPQPANLTPVLEPAQAGPGGQPAKRGGRLGGGITRGRGKSPNDILSNGTVSQQLKSKPSTAEEVTGSIDPKYFTSSTPGGTNYRQQIPADLPANVKRGAGLVRRIT